MQRRTRKPPSVLLWALVTGALCLAQPAWATRNQAAQAGTDNAHQTTPDNPDVWNNGDARFQSLFRSWSALAQPSAPVQAADRPYVVPRVIPHDRIIAPTVPVLSVPAPTYSPPVTTARLGCAENGSCYGDISPNTWRPKTVHVPGYFRKDGTYVRGHYRSR